MLKIFSFNCYSISLKEVSCAINIVVMFDGGICVCECVGEVSDAPTPKSKNMPILFEEKHNLNLHWKTDIGENKREHKGSKTEEKHRKLKSRKANGSTRTQT